VNATDQPISVITSFSPPHRDETLTVPAGEERTARYDRALTWAGASGSWAVWIGVAGAVVVIGLLVLVIAPRIPRQQAALTVLFPSAEEPPVAESAE